MRSSARQVEANTCLLDESLFKTAKNLVIDMSRPADAAAKGR